MSRTAVTAQRTESAVNGDSPDRPDDRCPACASNKTSDPNIRFKINPKCYHRVCEGCIDRHFQGGKAKCPVANCKSEIWKRDWRVQTFEDLRIEREVDIRKRVMSILNRREDEFESKRHWDDFLELREEMVMNLVLRTDVAATNRRLKEYEQANAISIKENAATATHGIPLQLRPATATDPTGMVKGLKEVVIAAPTAAYDPFQGMPTRRDYYEIRNDYPSRKLAKAKVDIKVLAGGFDFQQYYDESLLRAFAGLGCFIEDEKANNPEASPAGVVAGGASGDDVF